MATRRRTSRLLDVARESATLLRAVAPNRRAFTDLVDEMQCPRCHRWVKPRRYCVLCNLCRACPAPHHQRTGRRRWSQ